MSNMHVNFPPEADDICELCGELLDVCKCYGDFPDEGPEDQFRDDVEADADVLRSAGMGTDEDYGYFGDP